MLKTKTKKKKKFKIVEPIKEAQIIDYIPEKNDEILEGAIPDEDDYLNESISDDEDNIQVLEDKLFNNNDEEDDSKCMESIDILSKLTKTKTKKCQSSYSYGDSLETEVYKY